MNTSRDDGVQRFRDCYTSPMGKRSIDFEHRTEGEAVFGQQLLDLAFDLFELFSAFLFRVTFGPHVSLQDLVAKASSHVDGFDEQGVEGA